MSLVDDLIRERVQPTSLWHQVKISLSLGSDAILVCLEGWDDSAYYLHHVRQARPNARLEPVRCGNKKSTMWLHEQILARGKELERFYFFVDRDLDEFVWPITYDGGRLYVTDDYSFESSLVDMSAFDVIWSDIFGISAADPSYPIWRDRFSRFIAIHAKTLAAVAVGSINARRRMRVGRMNEVDCERRVKLKPDGLFGCVGATSVAAGQSIRVASVGEWRNLRALRNSLAHVPVKNLARGKNLLWAMVKFCETMRNALSAPGSTTKCRCVGPFTSDLLIQVLSSRLPSPITLSKFLT